MYIDHPITTERLIIRPFVHEDMGAVLPYASDPQVMHYMEEGPLDVQQVSAFIEKQCGDEATAFATVLKSNQQLIGHMVFHPWFAPHTYELGWVLHPAHQGHGYAPEAARTLLHHAFTTLQAHRVIATCQPENRPSYRVMEKIGMRREGHFRQCIYRGNGEWWDEYFYAMLGKEWQSLSNNSPQNQPNP